MAVTEVKTYQAFRGVDFSASPAVISEDHASDLLNMYIGSNGVMQKRPGWRILRTFQVSENDPTRLPINGIHFIKFAKGNGIVFVHAGTRLYSMMYTPDLRHADIVNGDVPFYRTAGDVPTATMASLILSYVSGSTDLEEWQVRNLDINGDGKVTKDDASLLLSYIVGMGADASNGVLPDSYKLVNNTDGTTLELANMRSVSFEHDGKLYLLDGANYICIKPSMSGGSVIGYKAERVDGYIPTTAVNGHYEYDELNEEGTNIPGSAANPGVWHHVTLNEERNLLQTKQINTFAADGIHKAFYLYENNCDVHKVEIYKRTRCKSVDGVDTPTQEHKSDVDAGTYTDPDTGVTTYYYYTYVWTEIYEESLFTEFSGSTSYAAGALVKRTVGTDVTYYECTANHYGAWNADHFAETYSYSATQASNDTPIQNAIAYATKIQFPNAPAAIEEGGVNIRVTYSPRKHSSDWAVSKDRGYIEKCSIVTKFGYYNDNRFFFAGNPDHRNMDFMSAVDDPTYFPNTGWTKIGSDMTAIQGYLHYGSELAIVKEDNNQDATIYMRSAILTEDNNIIFPVQQGAQGVGAISKWAFGTLNDDPLFLAKEGVYAIQGTDASQERNVPNRSFMVDDRLCNEIGATSTAVVFKDYYIVCNPTTGKCFVADARYMNLPHGTNNRSHGYEWSVWDNIPASTWLATDDSLFFGTQDGRLCLFNFDWEGEEKYSDGAEFVEGSTILHKWNPYGGGYPIHAYYVTKRDHLDVVDFKKTMLNDGGVITLQPYERSSAAITVTTDKGEWFVDQVHTDSDEPSVVIPIRHRFKWFDSISTRIENNEINEGLAILGVQYRYAITTNRR